MPIHGTLIGNLGADPELRTTQGGTQICKLRVASSSGYGDRQKTTWVGVALFGKTAEFAARELRKGARVAIHGLVYEDEWTAKDGTKRTSLQMDGNALDRLDAKPDGGREPARGGGRDGDHTQDPDGEIPY
jgi:single-strand DNA-binding protein